MPTSFKAKLAAGQLVKIFAVGRIPSVIIVDLFGLAGGFDGFWIDQEHTGLPYEQVMLLALAARANDMDCFVRMAPTNYALVTQNLEAGAGGVMAARIESAAHAEEFVQWAKFAPRGNRGMNTSGRDAHYTHKTAGQFAVDSNREQLVAIQIETARALAEADQIAAIDGVDLLFVGPSDLSQALGVLGQINHEKVWEGYRSVAAACRKHGKHWGTVAATPEFGERALELGCRMISPTFDVNALKRGIDDAKRMHPKLFA